MKALYRQLFQSLSVDLSMVLLAGIPMVAQCADLTVIHDGAGSVPMGTYYGHLVTGVNQPGVLPGTTFPMVTRLKPGRLPDHVVRQGLFKANWLAHPIFVLGTDILSFQWLQLHRQTLTELGASGLVIAASDETDFKDLQSFAGGLALAPVRGDWLEQKLLSARIATYPLVVMPDGRITNGPGGLATKGVR